VRYHRVVFGNKVRMSPFMWFTPFAIAVCYVVYCSLKIRRPVGVDDVQTVYLDFDMLLVWPCHAGSGNWSCDKSTSCFPSSQLVGRPYDNRHTFSMTSHTHIPF
jgi:hypothetical protein